MPLVRIMRSRDARRVSIARIRLRKPCLADFCTTSVSLTPGASGRAGRLVVNYSFAQLKAKFEAKYSIPISVRTIARAVKALSEKHSIQIWDVDCQPTRRTRGDGQGVSRYWVPHYRDVLEARRADPNIFTDASGHCWVWGSGRRFVPPAVAAAWGLTRESAAQAGPESRVREHWAGKSEEAPRKPVERAGPPATGPPETDAAAENAAGSEPVEKTSSIKNNPVWIAMREVYGKERKLDVADVNLVKANAHKAARQAGLGDQLTDDRIAWFIRDIAGAATSPIRFPAKYYAKAVKEEIRARLGTVLANQEQAAAAKQRIAEEEKAALRRCVEEARQLLANPPAGADALTLRLARELVEGANG